MSQDQTYTADGRTTARRIHAIGGGLLAALVVIATIAITSFGSKTDEARAFGEGDVPAIELLLNADRDAYQSRGALLDATLVDPTDQEALDGLLADYSENAQQVADRFGAYVELSNDLDGEAGFRADFDEAFAVWVAATGDVAADPAGRYDEVVALDGTFGSFRDAIDGIVGIYEEQVLTPHAEEFAASAGAVSRTIAIVTGLMLLVGGAVTWRTASSVRRGLEHSARASAESTSRALDAVESSSRTAGSLVDTASELGRLADALHRSAEGATEQASGAARSSEEVAVSVQTVAAAVEEMNATVSEIAENVSEATKVTTDAVRAAAETRDTVSALGESSREIGAVIEVIATIAEQTNLLALNATIEAARAGEEGKGFAVVANEVKELAQETATATTSITDRIRAIQQSTTRSTEAIGEIAHVIDRVAELQSMIAAAVEEQAATSREITSSLSSASVGTGEISETVRRVADAATVTTERAGDLRSVSDTLRGLAGRLTTLQADGGAPIEPPPAPGGEGTVSGTVGRREVVAAER